MFGIAFPQSCIRTNDASFRCLFAFHINLTSYATQEHAELLIESVDTRNRQRGVEVACRVVAVRQQLNSNHPDLATAYYWRARGYVRLDQWNKAKPVRSSQKLSRSFLQLCTCWIRPSMRCPARFPSLLIPGLLLCTQ